MRRSLLLLVPALCAFLVSAVKTSSSQDIMAADASKIYKRFDHGVHKKVFQREHLSCVACHAIGAPLQKSDDPTARNPLAPPAGACHYCHNPADGATPQGPTQCTACHDTISLPVTHGAGWTTAHGEQARLAVSECDACHPASDCVTCHTRKETARFQVHDRTWSAIHGIAALTDPASCGTCHLQVDCISCHRSGGKKP